MELVKAESRIAAFASGKIISQPAWPFQARDNLFLQEQGESLAGNLGGNLASMQNSNFRTRGGFKKGGFGKIRRGLQVPSQALFSHPLTASAAGRIIVTEGEYKFEEHY